MIICFIIDKKLSAVAGKLSNERGFCEIEYPAETKFVVFPNNEDYENSTRGFIFNKDFELKWMKINGEFHIVYTGKEEKLPSVAWKGKRSIEKMGEEYIYLWRNEKRVSKNLTYPVNGKRCKVLIEKLKGVDEQGEIYVERLVGLEGENEF